MAAIPATASADDGGAPLQTIRIEADFEGVDPFLGRHAASRPMTLYLRGDRLRVDFPGPGQRRVMFLHDAAQGIGWLIDLEGGNTLPVEGDVLPGLMVDPGNPCGPGWGRCEPLGARYLAGVTAAGWRYRNMNGRGPDGTSDGQLWVDPETGLVLAYEGRRRGRRERHAMVARDVGRHDLPESFFDLPTTIDLPADPSRR